MDEPIYFYGKTDDFYEFSNFSPHGFETEDGYWPTIEHYFQAQKFVGDVNAEYRKRIRTARRPKDAKDLGQSRTVPLREDWNDAKDEVMLLALRLKFESPKLRDLLLSTGNRALYEKSETDFYWGAGRDGSGLNRMGCLLERIRDELHDADPVILEYNPLGELCRL